MAPLVSKQPLKAFYTLLAVAFEAARLPLWILLYLHPSGRPHKNLTFRQAIGLKVSRQFVKHSSAVQVSTPFDLTPGKEKDRFVTYDPAPAGTYKGLLVDDEIKPVKGGGTWSPKPLTVAEASNENLDVVLHYHGGAYVVGDGRDGDTAFLINTLLKNARISHVFTPNYRLASNPGGRFPAALQDAISAYYYLVKTLGVPANRITISGDSAGGNLALAVLRYLEEYGKELDLPLPGCVWLWSPWVNIESARDEKALVNSKQYSTDYLTAGFVIWGAHSFAPLGHKYDPKSPYITPIGHPFKTNIPIFIHTCSAEVLYDDDMEIADELKRVGNKVELAVTDGAPHDILLLGHLLGFADEAKKAAKQASDFLHSERAKL